MNFLFANSKITHRKKENEQVTWDHPLAYRHLGCGKRWLFGVALLLWYDVAVSYLSATFVWLYITYYTYSLTYTNTRTSILSLVPEFRSPNMQFICPIW